MYGILYHGPGIYRNIIQFWGNETPECLFLANPEQQNAPRVEKFIESQIILSRCRKHLCTATVIQLGKHSYHLLK